jgi:1-acyl-sn-glycerol-3-phosphate acyltransferase
LIRHPGTVRIEILDPIPPALRRDVFLARLQHDIETATERLMTAPRNEAA